MAEQDFSYADYWEKCWNCENESDLASYLSGWNGSKSDETDFFRSRGIKRICDAACGYGAHTIALLSSGFDVEAFDVSQKAVDLTLAGLKKYGYENVKVKTSSILDTGYAEGSFDAVTAYAVIDHLTKNDAKKALREMMRIVKNGGAVLMSFDKAEEDDYAMPHRLLEDGSMLYGEGTPNDGMIFHPYDDSEIDDLINGCHVLLRTTDKKGHRIVVLEKEIKE